MTRYSDPYYLDVDADDFIWSEPCDFCEGSGHEIVVYAATWTDPSWYDYGTGRCDVCEGTGKQPVAREYPDDLPWVDLVDFEMAEAT